MTAFSHIWSRVSALSLVILVTTVPPLRAQQTPQPVTPTPAQNVRDSTSRIISPRTALFRSLLVPGWGQGSVGAYKRGGVFFGAQTASWYMLLKTLGRLGDAQEIEQRQAAFTADTLRARMAIDTVLARQLQDPIRFQARVDSAVVGIHSLVESRKQQRQDWITYTLFFMFASGVDAYIAAQLADFPTTIEARPTSSGGMQLQFNVPLRRKP